MRLPAPLRFALGAGLGALGRIEGRLLPETPLRFSPTFAVCLPRSGSTFVAQLLTGTLEVSFFPNAVLRVSDALGPENPCLPFATLTRASRFLGLAPASPDTPLHNRFGHAVPLRGGGSDTESVWTSLLWRHLLGVAPDGRLHLVKPRLARRTVAAVEHGFGRPFFDRSVVHQHHLLELGAVFPEALFVRIRRNPLAVAQSLYVAAVKRRALAMELPLFRRLRADHPRVTERPMEMVCRWVRTMETALDADMSRLDTDRVLALDYECVCRDPAGQVRRVAEWMSRRGAPTRLLREPAGSFPDRNVRQLERPEYEELRSLVAELYPAPVPALAEP